MASGAQNLVGARHTRQQIENQGDTPHANAREPINRNDRDEHERARPPRKPTPALSRPAPCLDQGLPDNGEKHTRPPLGPAVDVVGTALHPAHPPLPAPILRRCAALGLHTRRKRARALGSGRHRARATTAPATEQARLLRGRCGRTGAMLAPEAVQLANREELQEFPAELYPFLRRYQAQRYHQKTNQRLYPSFDQGTPHHRELPKPDMLCDKDVLLRGGQSGGKSGRVGASKKTAKNTSGADRGRSGPAVEGRGQPQAPMHTDDDLFRRAAPRRGHQTEIDRPPV